MKIKISADSTCDLSPELIERYHIGITPLYIIRGRGDPCATALTYTRRSSMNMPRPRASSARPQR